MVYRSTCGLISSFFTPGRAFSGPIWISSSKWPMLQTMAVSFIFFMWSSGDDVLVAGGGDEDVGLGGGFVHGHDLVAFHQGLQGADRVDFGDEYAAAEGPQDLGAAFADVAVAGDHRDLAGQHDVGGALDAVDQRFAAAVEVVELGFGNAVVDVDGRNLKRAVFEELVELFDTGGGLFGYAFDVS